MAVRWVRRLFSSSRLNRAARNLAYLLLAPVLGTIYLAYLTVALTLGAGLAVIIAGVPLLPFVFAGFRLLASFERWLANTMLGAAVPVLPDDRPAGSLWRRAGAAVADSANWSSMLWLTLRGFAGLVLVVPLLAVLIVSIALSFQAPFRGLLGWFPGATWQATGGVPCACLTVDYGTGNPPAWLGLPKAGPAGEQVGLWSWHLAAGLQSAWLVPLGLLVVAGLLSLAGLHARANVRLVRRVLGPPAQARIRALEQQAAQLAERARLAGELHDSIGHTLTLGVVQAAAAREVKDTDPAFVREALASIEQANRRALDELDVMLGVLRDERAAADPETAPGDLADLLARFQRAGLPVNVSLSVDPATLPPDMEREVYRLVREGCTNVLRHAGMVATSVTVAAVAEGVEARIVNEAGSGGTARPGREAGKGLRDMTKRIRAMGGSVDAGPTSDGGFQLSGFLPLRSRPPS